MSQTQLVALVDTFPLAALAACKNADPEIFFPTGKGRNSFKRARRICALCPVRLACLEWELQFEQGAGPRSGMGMFGGLSPSERYELIRERKQLQRKGTT